MSSGAAFIRVESDLKFINHSMMSVTNLFCFTTVDENTTSALVTKKDAWCGSTQWILTTAIARTQILLLSLQRA
jgi:hypothetical protein